jgi:hypothetical protein
MTSTSADVLPALFTAAEVADPPRVSRIETGLWSRSIVWTNVAGNAVGAAVLAGSWFGLSGSAPEDHGRWLGWAVAGLVAAALSNALLILTGRFQINGRVAAVGEYQLPAALAEGAQGRLVTAPGWTRYHDLDCQLVAGKATEAFDPATEGLLLPCGICEP